MYPLRATTQNCRSSFLDRKTYDSPPPNAAVKMEVDQVSLGYREDMERQHVSL